MTEQQQIPWKRAQQPTPVFLPGESHGQRSLAVYSPWDHTESDMTEVTSDKTRRRQESKASSEVLRQMGMEGRVKERPLYKYTDLTESE